MKYKTATGNSVLSAYNRAAKCASSERTLSNRTSAGFIFPAKMVIGEGYQVFVQLVRFSETELKRDKLSGGLLG